MRRGEINTLVLTLGDKRLVFAALVPRGKDPMEMTLGEWMGAPALSAVAIVNDFFERRQALNEEG